MTFVTDKTPDFQLLHQSTIAVLYPSTVEARDWIAENITSDHLEFGGGVVIEPRYVDDIVTGIKRTDLSLITIRS